MSRQKWCRPEYVRKFEKKVTIQEKSCKKWITQPREDFTEIWFLHV